MTDKNIATYLKSALQFQKQKEYKLALDEYKKILKLDQNNFQVWLNAGAIYSNIQKPQKAIVCFTQALKQKDDARVYYNLGVEYFKLHQFTDSMEAVKISIKHNPQFLSAYLLLAVVADQMNQFKTAFDSINSLLQYEPNHRGAHTAMVVLCIKNKKLDVASDYLDKLSFLGERKQVTDQLKSKLLLSKGEMSETIQLFQIMSRENPELKTVVKHLSQELPPENKEIIKTKKSQLVNKANKKEKDLVDLSLISLFEGKAEEAMNYLEKLDI